MGELQNIFCYWMSKLASSSLGNAFYLLILKRRFSISIKIASDRTFYHVGDLDSLVTIEIPIASVI